nr:chromosome transmission fidelity protein 8 homolog isoform X1 [Camelus dromedarius]
MGARVRESGKVGSWGAGEARGSRRMASRGRGRAAGGGATKNGEVSGEGRAEVGATRGAPGVGGPGIVGEGSSVETKGGGKEGSEQGGAGEGRKEWPSAGGGRRRGRRGPEPRAYFQLLFKDGKLMVQIVICRESLC